jgi:hypothetical protein
VERTAVEDPVYRPRDRPPVRCCGCERQETHPGEPLSQLVGTEPARRIVNRQQVRAGGRVAAVDQLLKRGDVGVGLVDA